MVNYFLRYNYFNILKNYILKDPLCDWFEIQNNKLFLKDENSYYKDYILKESSNYKRDVLHNIRELSKLNIPLETDVEKTKELIHSDFPLILQGSLLNKDNLYVKCDIIIKYSLIRATLRWKTSTSFF